jgi:hypothetical protein
MSALIPRGLHQGKREKGVMLLGRDLQDAREEQFVRMVCDGVPMGTAFSKAGFTSKDRNAPSNLWHVRRVQERANAILEARATQGVVTLPQVTDMLQRVFTGALHKEEYSAAHNAAFSLARVYGHVTDRNVLEVIRRPSRDPDAPSEAALADWVAGLPALNGPGAAGPEPEPPEPEPEVFLAPLSGPGAPLLGLNFEEALEEASGPQSIFSNDIKYLSSQIAHQIPQTAQTSQEALSPEPSRGSGLEKPNKINNLSRGSGPAGGRPENGAPTMAVTGTPAACGRSSLLERGRSEPLGKGVHPRPPIKEKRVPLRKRQVPGRVKGKVVVKNRRIKTTAVPAQARPKGPKGPKGPKVPVPSMEDLF